MSDPGQFNAAPSAPARSQPNDGVHLPRPTVWPAVMALGITLVMAGILLNLAFSVAGLVIFFLALAGWIGELQNE